MMAQDKFRIWIITLFPEYFEVFKKFGVAGSALSGERGAKFELNLVNVGEYSQKKWKGVDDSPYGGGAGMVMRPDVLKNALVEGVVVPGKYPENYREKLHIVYTGPRGKIWSDELARDFSAKYWHVGDRKDLVFICGRYEGIDERFIDLYVDQQISVGDYILTGGEIAVMLILDSSLRFVDGVLGNKLSSGNESFTGGLLEHPHYTKPQVFDEVSVPEILLSGHHDKIEKFRESERVRVTKIYRPDLLKGKSK